MKFSKLFFKIYKLIPPPGSYRDQLMLQAAINQSIINLQSVRVSYVFRISALLRRLFVPGSLMKNFFA